MRGGCLFLIACTAVPLPTISAQNMVQIRRGEWVRITAPACGIQRHGAPVEVLRGDTLSIPADLNRSSNAIKCPVAAVTKVEVLRGQKSNTLKGMGYGALAGAVLGAVVLGRAAAADGWQWEEFAVIGGAFGMVPGGLIGAMFGAGTKTDCWVEVPLERVRVSFPPNRGRRIAFGVLIRF